MSEAREEFTAEEYRLAARVAGTSATAAGWLRKANQIDAEELARLRAEGRIIADDAAEIRLVDTFGDRLRDAWQFGYNAAGYDRLRQDLSSAESFVYTKNPYARANAGDGQ